MAWIRDPCLVLLILYLKFNWFYPHCSKRYVWLVVDYRSWIVLSPVLLITKLYEFPCLPTVQIFLFILSAHCILHFQNHFKSIGRNSCHIEYLYFKLLDFFLSFFYRTTCSIILYWGHWYVCFGLLVTYPWVSQPGLDLLALVLCRKTVFGQYQKQFRNFKTTFAILWCTTIKVERWLPQLSKDPVSMGHGTFYLSLSLGVVYTKWSQIRKWNFSTVTLHKLTYLPKQFANAVAFVQCERAIECPFTLSFYRKR